jgi:hypothetical protein
MIETKRWLAIGVGLALAACGGQTDNQEPETAQASAQAKPALYHVADPCGGLSDAEAAALLGIPAEDLDKTVLGPMFDNACSLKSKAKPLGPSISFSLAEEGSVADAEAAFERQAGNFATTVQGEPVEGLGDQATWFGSRDPVVLDRLLARKGNVWLDVISAPEKEDGARRVAEAVLGKLG